MIPFATSVAPICPHCNNTTELVNGRSIYPHRPDLTPLSFWQCKPCDAYVGCHKRNRVVQYVNADGTVSKFKSDGTLSMGTPANTILRHKRSAAHDAIDPLWKNGASTRREIYEQLAKHLNISISNCDIAMFNDAQCKATIAFARELLYSGFADAGSAQ